MIKPKTWNEFRDSGMLWFINTILQPLGWAIVFEYNDDGSYLLNAYPAKTKFTGFSQDIVQEGTDKFKKSIHQDCREI